MNSIVANICPGNRALAFIDQRIASDDYRGAWSSQHNRYTFEQIKTILSLFDQFAPNGALMAIRTTDISKRPHNTPEEAVYAKFCLAAKQAAGIGTQDAMRKNLFVDLHRMSLIARYDARQNAIAPLARASIKYASLTDQGLRLIRAKNQLDAYFVFSKGINIMLGGTIDTLLQLLDEEHALGKISMHEFMFFASAVGSRASFGLSVSDCADLIGQYRGLSRLQKDAVIGDLKERLRPENYAGAKTAKRDFHNWKKKAQQVYYLLAQTVYFSQEGELLQPATAPAGSPARLVRSQSEKRAYFVNHAIGAKRRGFELHHVVPLAWSESAHQFKLLDKWQNMVYIDAYSHARISQNGGKNVVMRARGEDLALSDYADDVVHLTRGKHVEYCLAKQPVMLQYNNDLLQTIK